MGRTEPMPSHSGEQRSFRFHDDPITTEVAEIVLGWRHLTITRREPMRAEDREPWVRLLDAVHTVASGRCHAMSGDRTATAARIVVGISPPRADEDIELLRGLAERLNPGDWRIEYIGRYAAPSAP
ncbi:hypothetical protein [Allonocardiopsis opalescens]|uniref:Uncharacterized protein n=1 Tax=Allonocardiopsis opalescens TaxID=1144618 RepID=A0A2T0QAF5_9ACTN|nr:hypothetical protein [Allonocardiopsis opalescens]PRY00868.1 hypothetical protein CLV72_102500 [Allonocardiopsis opalescens]